MIFARFSRDCAVLCIASACILFAPVAHAQDTYVSALEDGAALLRAGNAQLAAQSLNRAVRLDANDSTVWDAYGILLLDTSNLPSATKCFTRALSLSAVDSLAKLGLAVCNVADAKLSDARGELTPEVTDQSPAAARLLAYVQTLSQPANTPVPDAALSPAHWPITASNDPRRPLFFRWRKDPTIHAPDVPRETLKGKVTLVAPAAATLTMATFDIDGAPAGMTNVTPCVWMWNTAEWSDGWHFVRITGTRPRGAPVVNEKWVITSNGAIPSRASRYDLSKARGLLDEVLTIYPDSRLARLARAKTALAGGLRDEARTELEAVVAEDPYFKDAAHLLRTIPPPQVPEEIWRGSRNGKRIALTFDDGPNARHTPGLLDALDAVKAPATFMIVGKQAAQYPEMVRRMAAAGHEVENHTWNHRNLRHLNDAEALKELASTKRLIFELTGTRSKFFRPPGGNIGAAAHNAARTLGLSAAMWTFEGGKAEGLPVEDMVPRFVHAAKPGAIYLIHNGTDKMEALVTAVVKALRARGYEFVRLDQLIAGKK